MQALEIKITLGTSNFTRPLDDASRKVKEFAQGSLGALQQELKKLNNLRLTIVDPNELAKVNQQIDQTKLKIIELSTAGRTLAPALDQSTRASANAGHALLNLNYIIRDSPYFFHNFALGVMAIGNNINPFIDSLQRATKESGGFAGAMKNMWGALAGGAGLTLALSLAVTAIQAFVFAQSKKKTALKESGDAISDNIKLLNDLSTTYEDAQRAGFEFMQTQGLQTLQSQLSALEQKRKLKFGDKSLSDIPEKTEIFIPSRSTIEAARTYTENSRELASRLDEQITNLRNKIEGISKPFDSFVEKFNQINDASDKGVSSLAALGLPIESYRQALKRANDEFEKAFPQDRGIYEKRIKTLESFLEQFKNKTKKEKDLALESIKDEVAKNKGLRDIGLITEKEYHDSLRTIYAEYNLDFKTKSNDRLNFFGSLNQEIDKYLTEQANIVDEGLKKISEAEEAHLKREKAFKDEYLKNLRGQQDEFNRLLSKAQESPFDTPRSRADKVAGEFFLLSPEARKGLSDALVKQEEMKTRLAFIDQAATTAGNAISNAFLSGKNAIEAATQAIMQFITQLIIMQTVKGIFASMMPGGTFMAGFSSFNQGGIAAANGLIVPGNSTSGDRVMARVNSGEMILNKTQQSKLFNMINRPNLRGGGSQSVQITGTLEAKQDKFVVDFEKAKKRYIHTKTY